MISSLKALFPKRAHRQVGRRAAIAEGLGEIAQGRSVDAQVARAEAQIAECEQRIAACMETLTAGVKALSGPQFADTSLRLDACWRVRDAAAHMQRLTHWQRDLQLYRDHQLGLCDDPRRGRFGWRTAVPMELPQWRDYAWD